MWPHSFGARLHGQKRGRAASQRRGDAAVHHHSGFHFSIGFAAFLVLSKRDPFGGWNAGFIALCLNSAVAVLVSLFAPVKTSALAGDFSANASSNP
jgi:hypothetical protein